MPDKHRHEFELKFKVGESLTELVQMRPKFIMAGFEAGIRAIETDYLPDTPDDACKNAHMLLRFRHVESVDSDKLLLTLKIRQSDQGLLHFHELETDLFVPDTEMIKVITEVVYDLAGIMIGADVLEAKSLEEVVIAASDTGFTKHRILLSKYRENFSHGRDNATIDYFPDGMGVYVEFESYSSEELRNSVRRAGFENLPKTTIDYGEILKQHKSGQARSAQRTALFLEQELSVLRSMF